MATVSSILGCQRPEIGAADSRIAHQVGARPAPDYAADVHHLGAARQFERSDHVLLDHQNGESFSIEHLQGLDQLLHQQRRQA